MRNLFLIMLFTSSGAFGAEISIVQVDKVFMNGITDEQAEQVWDDPEIEEKYKIEKIEANVGDTLIFKNRDEARHNVNGKLNSKEAFDVKLQEPGIVNDRAIKLEKAGEYTVNCVIHPKMKFKVIVK